jgi:glycosyltransferase involved in cell wall biosynthesis
MIQIRVIELNLLVSVVIPTKNSSKTLESCIQSIQKQSYPNIETIIVDSKSNDDTLNISNSLGCKQVISTNWKLLGARYEGLKVATGDYVLMLDSDQILEKSAIERCVVLAQRYDMLCLEEMPYEPRTFVEKLNQADRQLIHHEFDIQKHPLYGTLLARFYRRDILEKTFKHIPSVLLPFVVFYDHAIIYYEAWKVSNNVGIVPNALWHNEPTTITELLRKNFRYGKSTKTLLKSNHYNDLVKNKVRLRKTNSKKLLKYRFLSSLLLLLKAPAYLSGLYF